MCDRDNPARHDVYRIRNNAIIKEERMAKSGYPSPQGDSFCLILDEAVSLGSIDIPAMIARRKTELGGSFIPDAPFCVKGCDLLPGV